MSISTPCSQDLLDAASLLQYGSDGSECSADCRSRVATWLKSHARDLEDRRNARAVGVTLKYYRKNMKGTSDQL